MLFGQRCRAKLYSLDQKRYTWRHDSVLVNIRNKLVNVLEKFNNQKAGNQLKASKEWFKACFVKSGGAKTNLSKDARDKLSRSILESANDWELLVDLEKQVQFPSSIIATSLRPDVVLWSKMSRKVILIELTCCAEEGIHNAHVRKDTKYTPLVNDINGRLLCSH